MRNNLSVDTSELIDLTNRLERINRSAFPVAVRNTLNSAAFDVKQKTMPASAAESFVLRQKNFWKKTSRVEMARGFDTKTMHSEVGFVSLGGTNKSVEDLEQQEKGGSINGRSFVALKQSRVGNSWKKNVKKENRISDISKIVSSRKMKGKSRGQRLKQAFATAGVGGHVLSESGFLFRIESGLVNGRFQTTSLFAYKKKRKVTVKATHFMEKASDRSAKKLDEFYLIEANKQFKRNGLL
jgi:hypothetical protein